MFRSSEPFYVKWLMGMSVTFLRRVLNNSLICTYKYLCTGSSISGSDHTEGTYPEETSWSTGYRGLLASTAQHYSE